MSLDKKAMEQKTKRLEDARKYLKTQFIGIDECIDKFINSVKVWYITPELQTRPLIVSLWGLTGSGKTDLVRKFVNYIDFTDRFCEIQMDSKEGSATVEDYLDNTFSFNESGILLLDEIQRFRSVTDDGKESNSTKYQDLWMLLSDGVLQSNSKIKQELVKMMVEDEYHEEREKLYNQPGMPGAQPPADPELTEKRNNLKYKMYYYEASRLKKLLKLEEDVNTVMSYSKEQKMQLIKSKINSKEIYEGKKYNKLLIIIAGNLDEAFTMARNVEDADHDADVYHEYSKTIDIIKVKSALRTRFKPEQIARFGNIHIIYPILNRNSNYEIIKQKITELSTNIMTQHAIELNFDSSVYDVVYQNGVFPVQGVRPLLSTISAIVENSVPIFLFEYLKKNSKDPINISHKDGKLFATIGGKKISYEVPRVLDDIRKKSSENKLALVAVHEAGHAIAYAVLNKISPSQIVASTASQHTGGFIGTHGNFGAKKDLFNDVIIDYAGRAAEELIFGKECVTLGAQGDYVAATATLSRLVRETGMDQFFAVYTPFINNKMVLDSDASVDSRIEALASDLYKQSVDLIKKHREYLLTIAEALVDKKKLEQEEFVELSEPFIGKVSMIGSGDRIEVNFNYILQKALRNKTTQTKTVKFKKSEAKLN